MGEKTVGQIGTQNHHTEVSDAILLNNPSHLITVSKSLVIMCITAVICYAKDLLGFMSVFFVSYKLKAVIIAIRAVYIFAHFTQGLRCVNV